MAGAPQGIKSIRLSLPYHMGSVNCYLVDTGSGYVLVDTGVPGRRADLECGLASAGCEPGALNLILLTHGDFDHIGNAAYLRRRLAARIAMHRDDAGMAERGDMFWNKQKGQAVVRWLVPLLYRFPLSDRFEPDHYLEDGDELSDWGWEAQVIAIPGHSKGSIGFLTAGGDLFCGDLLENTKTPALNPIMDDDAAASASVDRLRGLGIRTVYPGHGDPFPMALFAPGGHR